MVKLRWELNWQVNAIHKVSEGSHIVNPLTISGQSPFVSIRTFANSSMLTWLKKYPAKFHNFSSCATNFLHFPGCQAHRRRSPHRSKIRLVLQNSRGMREWRVRRDVPRNLRSSGRCICHNLVQQLPRKWSATREDTLLHYYQLR